MIKWIGRIEKMRILVLATSYPRPDGSVSLQYIHSRNVQYVQQGIDVSVISFDAKKDYELDHVKVFTLDTYAKRIKNERFDLLISHAPNLRNHYRFIKKYGHLHKKFVFFFHGHEVLKTAEVYPKPYDYMKKKQMETNMTRRLYDHIKLFVWRRYFKKIAYKSHFVFVSKWMYQMFLESVKIDPALIEGRMSIIYNCIGKDFEKYSYYPKGQKQYDFITIRNNLDGSKYSIDIVTKIAKDNPQYHFCVIGKGEFYTYNEKPKNLEWIDKSLSHDDVMNYLNRSKCALIPTRTDSQGVMACEMATFGIPVITSDIDVCTEVFAGFPNVDFIRNEAKEFNIEPLFNRLIEGLPYEKNKKYFACNTILKEVDLFKEIVKNNNE